MSEILREFLIGLGYQVDQGSQQRYNKAVDDATKGAQRVGQAATQSAKEFEAAEKAKVHAAEDAGKRIAHNITHTGNLIVGGTRNAVQNLGSLTSAAANLAGRLTFALAGAATGITAATTAIAHRLDELYWASRRTGASAENIRGLQYAFSQTGGSAQDALASLEAFSDALKTNPGNVGLLRSFGVLTEEGGKARDRVAVLNDTIDALQRKFGGPGSRNFHVARMFAADLGIDPRMLEVSRADRERFAAERRAMQLAAGLDPEAAARQGKAFTEAWVRVTQTFSVISERVGGHLAENLVGPWEKFQTFLLANSGRLSEALENLLRLVLDLAREFATWLGGTFDDPDKAEKWWRNLNAGIDKFRKDVIEVKDAFIEIATTIKKIADFLGSGDIIGSLATKALRGMGFEPGNGLGNAASFLGRGGGAGLGGRLGAAAGEAAGAGGIIGGAQAAGIPGRGAGAAGAGGSSAGTGGAARRGIFAGAADQLKELGRRTGVGVGSQGPGGGAAPAAPSTGADAAPSPAFRKGILGGLWGLAQEAGRRLRGGAGASTPSADAGGATGGGRQGQNGLPEVDALPGAYKEILDHISSAEGTAGRGDYNASLGYGRYLPGGREQDLTKLTLNEISQLGYYMRRQPGNPNSSALGKYQIVGDTMRRLMVRMKLTGDELFDEAMQDRMAAELARDTGGDPARLAREWASLRGQRLAKAVEIMSRIPRGADPTPGQRSPVANNEAAREALRGIRGGVRPGWNFDPSRFDAGRAREIARNIGDRDFGRARLAPMGNTNNNNSRSVSIGGHTVHIHNNGGGADVSDYAFGRTLKARDQELVRNVQTAMR